MQAVILAAGRGTRMGELTSATPKPLLEVAGKSLLELKFDELPDNVDEIIIVVGYLGSSIHDRFGGMYNGKRLLYIEQENPTGGTADALWQAKDILEDRFLVMMGDDLYSREDILHCVAQREGWLMAVKKTENMGPGGNVKTDEAMNIVTIEEGDHTGKSGNNGTNLFSLDTRVFGIEPVPKAPGSSEMGLPQTVIAASKKLGVPFKAFYANGWFPVTTPEDLKKAEEFLQQVDA